VTVPAESRVFGQGAAGTHGRRGAWDSPSVVVIPAVITLGVTLYQIGRPTLWQDEISTLSDTERTLPELFRLLGHIDAVHGAYYLLIWAVVRVAGSGAVVLRFPSAVAMAVAAAGVTLLGQRLVSTRAGIAAGLVFAALPQVSWYGQDAREIAGVTALATLASYMFVRALEAAPGERRKWLIGYGATLSLLGLFNLFALLLIPAHGLTLAVFVFLRHRQAGRTDVGSAAEVAGAGAGQQAGAWPPVRGWLTAAVIALVVASPVIVLGWQQRSQIAWLRRPDVHTLTKVGKVIGPPGLCLAVLVITTVAVVVSALGGSSRLRTDWPPRLTALSLPWLILPLAILLSVSLIHPVFTQRYIVFCLPAAALLFGAGLAALGRVAGAVALILFVALALPAQVQARAVDGHGQDLRAVSLVLADHAHRGDAVLFGTSYARKIEIAYPAGFRSLRDVSRGKSALQVAEPAASNASAAVIRHRLTTVTRLWTITRASQPQFLPALHQLGFGLVHGWMVSGYRIDLYRRHAATRR
jgi:mannosyltransferase